MKYEFKYDNKVLDIGVNARQAFMDKDYLKEAQNVFCTPSELLVFASNRFPAKTVVEILKLFLATMDSVPQQLRLGTCCINNVAYFGLFHYCNIFFHRNNAILLIRNLLCDMSLLNEDESSPIQRIRDGEIEYVSYVDSNGRHHFDGFLNKYFDTMNKSGASQSSYGKTDPVGYSVNKSIDGVQSSPLNTEVLSSTNKSMKGYLYKDVVFKSLDDLSCAMDVPVRAITQYSYLWRKYQNMYDVSAAVRLCLVSRGTYQSLMLNEIAEDFKIGFNPGVLSERGYIRAIKL